MKQRLCEEKDRMDVHYVPDDCENCKNKCPLYDMAVKWGAKKWTERETMEIKELQKEIHENAKKHGWWEDDRTFGEQCSLFHSEISEAFEERRNHHGITEIYFNPENPGKPEGIPVELADVVIRIMDFFERHGMDLGAIIALKHQYNKGRSYRHGGKAC